jgi:hypothetical protein
MRISTKKSPAEKRINPISEKISISNLKEKTNLKVATLNTAFLC